MSDKLTRDEILALMRDGWECAYCGGSRGDGWWSLQRGGIGYGGPTKRPHAATMDSLRRRGLIAPAKIKQDWRYTVYIPIDNPAEPGEITNGGQS